MHASERRNHPQNLVDSLTSTYTQNMENLWMCMKMKKMALMGQHESLFDTHLIEVIWLRCTGDCPFQYLLRAV